MKEYNRVYAKIDLDAAAYNMEQMKTRIGGGARLIAVVKTDAYGHGAVPLAEVFEKLDYVWGYAVATLDEGIDPEKARDKEADPCSGVCFPRISMMIWSEMTSGRLYIWKRWPWENGRSSRKSRKEKPIFISRLTPAWEGSASRLRKKAQI